jgi:hypothetical protein
MTENLNVFIFETSNPNFSPGEEVAFLSKFAKIPGSS